jgi:hypothetical protein
MPLTFDPIDAAKKADVFTLPLKSVIQRRSTRIP